MKRSPGGVLIASHISYARDGDGNLVLMMEDEHNTVFAVGTLLLDDAQAALGEMMALMEESIVEAMQCAGHA